MKFDKLIQTILNEVGDITEFTPELEHGDSKLESHHDLNKPTRCECGAIMDKNSETGEWECSECSECKEDGEEHQ